MSKRLEKVIHSLIDAYGFPPMASALHHFREKDEEVSRLILKVLQEKFGILDTNIVPVGNNEEIEKVMSKIKEKTALATDGDFMKGQTDEKDRIEKEVIDKIKAANQDPELSDFDKLLKKALDYNPKKPK